jgi:serine/threonine protein kinase
MPAGLAPGTVVAGYRVEEQIGAGGMAVVYRARDVRLGRPVALKVLSPGLASDDEFRTRFIREWGAATAVEHPHIIPVYGADDAMGILYIAMRLVNGGDLSSRVRQGGALDPAVASAFISAVASALDAAHAIGLVHRDIKPGNMLLDSASGLRDHVYLSDFGLTKNSQSGTALTATGSFMGTPDYVAPEQISGAHVDGRTDQYALACVAVHLLTGRPPFNRTETVALLWAHMSEPPPSVSQLRPGLSYAVDDVIARAMAKAPDQRYGSCGQFASALHQALGVDLGSVPPVSAGPGGTVLSPHNPVSDPRPAPAAAPSWMGGDPTRAAGPSYAGPGSPAPRTAAPSAFTTPPASRSAFTSPPSGSGPSGSGPASSGPASSGPASSGPASSGPASSRPSGYDPGAASYGQTANYQGPGSPGRPGPGVEPPTARMPEPGGTPAGGTVRWEQGPASGTSDYRRDQSAPGQLPDRNAGVRPAGGPPSGAPQYPARREPGLSPGGYRPAAFEPLRHTDVGLDPSKQAADRSSVSTLGHSFPWRPALIVVGVLVVLLVLFLISKA